jgi:polysaccharide biosynthesis transport protein
MASPVPYRSTAVLFVSTPRDDAQTAYQGDEYARARLASYLALGKSTEVAQHVINDVGLKVDATTLVAGTKLVAVPGTSLLQLTATGTTAQLAQMTGNAYVEELSRSVRVLETVSGGLTPRAALTVIQPATFGQPARAFPAWMLLGAAGWAGLLIGLFAAVAVFMLDGRIRQPEDAAEAAGTPVLARFASFVPWEQPEAQPWAGESGRELRSALDRLALLGSNVILVASAERGAGKTGIALTVARALADRDATVALVDFDSRGSHLADSLRLNDSLTVRDLIQGYKAQIAQDPHAEIAPDSGRHRQPLPIGSAEALPAANWHGVSVIPFGASEDNPGSTADSPATASLFAALRGRYDWVVIDTPAAIDFSDAPRLAHHADVVLLIAKAGRTGFDELRKVSVDVSREGGHIAGVVFVDETKDPGRVNSRYRKSEALNNNLDPPNQLADLSG